MFGFAHPLRLALLSATVGLIIADAHCGFKLLTFDAKLKTWVQILEFKIFQG